MISRKNEKKKKMKEKMSIVEFEIVKVQEINYQMFYLDGLSEMVI